LWSPGSTGSTALLIYSVSFEEFIVCFTRNRRDTRIAAAAVIVDLQTLFVFVLIFTGKWWQWIARILIGVVVCECECSKA